MNDKKFYPQQQNTEGYEHTGSVEMDIYIQMILDEANLLYKKKQLEKQIDLALEQGDKAQFMKLTKQYKEIQHILN